MVRPQILCGLMLAHCAALFAQQASTSWNALEQLRPGDRIQVTNRKSDTRAGTFVALSERSITVNVKQAASSIERSDVLRVRVRDASNRRWRVVLYTAIGAGIGLVVGLIGNAPLRNEGNGCTACVVGLVGGLGGLGAVLGMQPQYRTLYQAP